MMARQSNADYWAQRIKNMEEALLDQSYSYVQNLDTQFARAQAEIEKQIAVWYQRFAVNNEITLAEAKRLLNSTELAEFQWSVQEYIKYGQENAFDGRWMRQLENASARVHISRLEAIKLQIQQQAEVLYSNQLDYIDEAARQMYEGSYYHTAFEIQRGLGVGWSMHAINKEAIAKVLSRPWTNDNQTFRDRCWTNKQSLVNSVNTQLTQMIIRGEAPDRAIKAISKQFDVSRQKAGRLVMTESAYFASAAQKDCFTNLDVERYRIVASLDHETCELCGALDSQVFKMSEYQVGLTAPPFHPWCRCCTCPYFEDMAALGERYARDAETGERFKIPGNMTYEQWRAKQNELHGDGAVEKMRTMNYNESADKAQLERYQQLLGKKGNLRGLEAFQKFKYDDPDGYAALKIAYADKSLQKRIVSHPEWTTVLEGRQGKHILGHNNYTKGRSYLTVTMDEVQELITKYAGTGAIKRDASGKWTHKEFVIADRVIGYHLTPDGAKTPTRRFSISYATTGKKKGAHIVPAKEE